MWTPKQTLIAGAVVVVGLWYLKRQAGQAVDAVTTAIDPTDHDNLANRAAEGLYTAVTGSDGTPGTDLYDWVHGEERWWN